MTWKKIVKAAKALIVTAGLSSTGCATYKPMNYNPLDPAQDPHGQQSPVIEGDVRVVNPQSYPTPAPAQPSAQFPQSQPQPIQPQSPGTQAQPRPFPYGPYPSTPQPQAQPQLQQPIPIVPFTPATIIWNESLVRGERGVRCYMKGSQKNEIQCPLIKGPVYISNTPSSQVADLVSVAPEQQITCELNQTMTLRIKCTQGEWIIRQGITSGEVVIREYAGCIKVDPARRDAPASEKPIIPHAMQIRGVCVSEAEAQPTPAR